MNGPYLHHLTSSKDLETTYEAIRAGFVALALEKNRRATPYVEEARALQIAASTAQSSADLLNIPDIQPALLTAAGVSDKAKRHLSPQDRVEAINGLIRNFLEPAGQQFLEELVFRFLLIRGDALGGSMRNIGGGLAQRKMTRSIISALGVAGIPYVWLHSRTGEWARMSGDDADIEIFLRGIGWQKDGYNRTLMYDLRVPFVGTNVDLCLLSGNPRELTARRANRTVLGSASAYVALGELKGGIDPAGADEHWKTARTALTRVRKSFAAEECNPALFFVGAAVEARMADEIWSQLEGGLLANAANLTDDRQIASLARWLCNL